MYSSANSCYRITACVETLMVAQTQQQEEVNTDIYKLLLKIGVRVTSITFDFK